MSEQDLERLIEATVAAVLQQLQAGRPAGPLVRVLIADTDTGLDFALASLADLARRVRVEYVLSDGDRAQVTPAYVRQHAGAPAVFTHPEIGCPAAWARGADLVVAATLDRATALRVALTMPETFGSQLLFEALRVGRPVVVATDGLALDAPEATPQLRAALAEPVGRLEVFGAECVAARDLGPVVERRLAAPTGFNAATNRPLITAEDVEAAEGELVLAPGAILTPLALDRARELGVILRRLPH